MTPPESWRGIRFLSPDLKAWVQRVADHHYEHGGADDDAELSTDCFPICASRGFVRPHIDEFGGAELGKRIFGLVIRSDHHYLRSAMLGPNCISLHEGDVYAIDPHDRHWTECDQPDGQLIFAATFLPLDDPRIRDPHKIAHDLFWEMMQAHVEQYKRKQQEEADEKFRYRGIAQDV